MNWMLKSFSQLTTDELYAVLALRNQVFICEQQCAYQDLDGVDQDTLHLFAKGDDNQQIIAYARLLPQGIAFKESINRASDCRSKSAGKWHCSSINKRGDCNDMSSI
ncbi:putative acyltransferase [Proteus vulgaris]|nr:putative acyltransferase [Proteus vulgaris]